MKNLQSYYVESILKGEHIEYKEFPQFLVFIDTSANEQNKKIGRIIICDAKIVDNEIKIIYQKQPESEYTLDNEIITMCDDKKYHLCEGEQLLLGENCDVYPYS